MVASRIRYVFKDRRDGAGRAPVFSEEEIRIVRNFHKSFAQYRVTPLHALDRLARDLGVGKIWIKDESFRFGLNAFKVLGASFAIGKYLGERMGLPIEELTFDQLSSPEIKGKLGTLTFVTATDGNHGRGVAWAARQLGQRSVVFLPKGASPIRVENIRGEGAEAYVTEYNYDDTVRHAARYAEEMGGVVVQDTAWPGYEDIPRWIMQGYVTIMAEALDQIEASGEEPPTHVFLQAGVGSFAGSMLGYLVSRFGEERPFTIIMEPETAACIYKSAVINDGKPHAVGGDLATIMAGLSCGEPNTISWEILRDYADMYVSCPDHVAARGVRILASPLPGDPQVISGESGAVGMGPLSLLAAREELKEMRDLLQLDTSSRVLIISTEGDTDPVTYRKIVWDGAFPSVDS